MRSICLTKAADFFPFSNRFAPYTESKQKMMTFLLKVGGISYGTLGKVFKYSLLAAAGIALVYVNRNYRPKL